MMFTSIVFQVGNLFRYVYGDHPEFYWTLVVLPRWLNGRVVGTFVHRDLTLFDHPIDLFEPVAKRSEILPA